MTREAERIQSIENETIVKIAAGACSSFAVTASGGVYTWLVYHILSICPLFLAFAYNLFDLFLGV